MVKTVTLVCEFCNNTFIKTQRRFNQAESRYRNTGIEGNKYCSGDCVRRANKGKSHCRNNPNYVEKITKKFWSKVNKTPGLGNSKEYLNCWEWVGNVYRGYGDFSAYGENVPAHRFGWEIQNNSKIREGMVIMHLCDNPKCVKGDHLREGTNKDNSDDKVRKGRHLKGSQNKRAKITDCQALWIRKFCTTMTKKELAAKFNISPGTVSGVINNKSFKHLPKLLINPYKYEKNVLQELTEDQKLKILKLIKIEDNGCWSWLGTIDTHTKYGKIAFNRCIYTAHRVTFELFHDIKLKNEDVIRHGDNCERNCVSPFHLSIGTYLDNAQDRKRLGGYKYNINSSAVLSYEKVLEARELHKTGNYTYIELGKKYSVSPGTISEAIRGVTWKHLLSNNS